MARVTLTWTGSARIPWCEAMSAKSFPLLSEPDPRGPPESYQMGLLRCALKVRTWRRVLIAVALGLVLPSRFANFEIPLVSLSFPLVYPFICAIDSPKRKQLWMARILHQVIPASIGFRPSQLLRSRFRLSTAGLRPTKIPLRCGMRESGRC